MPRGSESLRRSQRERRDMTMAKKAAKKAVKKAAKKTAKKGTKKK
jgi:hypothetical protein